MLDEEGVKKEKYEKLFSEKKFFEVRNTAYRAWLLYKIDAVGDETESVDALLDSLIPKNVPKRKTTRKTLTNQIQGPDRHNPLSEAFREQLREIEERKQKKTSKNTQPKISRAKKKAAAIVDIPSNTTNTNNNNTERNSVQNNRDSNNSDSNNSDRNNSDSNNSDSINRGSNNRGTNNRGTNNRDSNNRDSNSNMVSSEGNLINPSSITDKANNPKKRKSNAVTSPDLTPPVRKSKRIKVTLS